MLLPDMVAAGAERQPVQSLTLVVQTFGRLRYESQIVLDLMASKLITELDAMGPEQLVQLVGHDCGVVVQSWVGRLWYLLKA